jgi:hypothetical protein
MSDRPDRPNEVIVALVRLMKSFLISSPNELIGA